MIGNRLKARALYYSLLTIVAIEVVLGLILLLAVWGLADLIFPIGLIALVSLSVYKCWYYFLKAKENERKC